MTLISWRHEPRTV